MVASFVTGWYVGLRRRHKRPVRLILRAFGDPTPEELHLLIREAADFGIGRRHHAVGIVGDDAGHELAGGCVFRDDGPRAALQFGDGLVGDVEPQASLPVDAVGTVAGEAVFGKDRPDVAVERKLRGPRGRRGMSGARDRRREHARGENCHDSWEGVRRHTNQIRIESFIVSSPGGATASRWRGGSRARHGEGWASVASRPRQTRKAHRLKTCATRGSKGLPVPGSRRC